MPQPTMPQTGMMTLATPPGRVNPFDTTPPLNWRTPQSYQQPVQVDVPRLDFNYWFQNQPQMPFQFTVPLMMPQGRALLSSIAPPRTIGPSTGMMALRIPQMPVFAPPVDGTGRTY